MTRACTRVFLFRHARTDASDRVLAGRAPGVRLNAADLQRDPRFDRFNALRSCAAVPGGERMQQVQARMVQGLQALHARHPGADIAVFGHGDPIRSALAWYAGMPLDLLLRLEVSLASASAVEMHADSVRILAINLGAEGLA